MKKYIYSSVDLNIANTLSDLLSSSKYPNTQLKFYTVDEVGDDYVEFSISGGLNGHGDWSDYFQDLSNFVEDCIQYIPEMEDIYLIDAENDCVDDVFYAHFRANFE